MGTLLGDPTTTDDERYGRKPSAWRDVVSWAVLYVAATLAAGGVSLVVAGILLLPDAHHHRQRSGEGLLFAWTAVPLVAGGTAVLLAACLACWEARRQSGSRRSGLYWAAGALVAFLAAAAAGLTVFVDFLGGRCYGACG